MPHLAWYLYKIKYNQQILIVLFLHFLADFAVTEAAVSNKEEEVAACNHVNICHKLEWSKKRQRSVANCN